MDGTGDEGVAEAGAGVAEPPLGAGPHAANRQAVSAAQGRRRRLARTWPPPAPIDPATFKDAGGQGKLPGSGRPSPTPVARRAATGARRRTEGGQGAAPCARPEGAPTLRNGRWPCGCLTARARGGPIPAAGSAAGGDPAAACRGRRRRPGPGGGARLVPCSNAAVPRSSSRHRLQPVDPALGAHEQSAARGGLQAPGRTSGSPMASAATCHTPPDVRTARPGTPPAQISPVISASGSTATTGPTILAAADASTSEAEPGHSGSPTGNDATAAPPSTDRQTTATPPARVVGRGGKVRRAHAAPASVLRYRRPPGEPDGSATTA